MIKKTVLIISFISVICFFASFAQGIVIDIKKESYLDGSVFCLSDIASIKDNDAKAVEELAKIKLGEVPASCGSKKSISVAEITQKIRQAGIDAGKIDFSGEQSAVILPKVKKIAGVEILNRLKKYIYDNMPWDKDEAVIESSGVIDDVDTVNGDAEFEITPLSQNEYIGLARYAVIVNVNGVVQQKLDIAIKITVYKKIIVALKPINRGETFDNGNIGISRRELTAGDQDALINPKEILGMVCSRSIPARSVIKKSYLSLPVIVRKDELVQVLFESNGLSVQSVAVAKDNGSLGGFIRVQNIDTKKMFFAKVIGDNMVSINGISGGNDNLRR